MRHRQPMNICKHAFKTKLQAEEWAGRQVIRRQTQLEYVTRVQDADRAATKVEVLDRSASGFEPRSGDEPLSRVCRIWRQNGSYRVGIPAGEW